MDSYLIGYDFRARPELYLDRQWSPTRRERFLLDTAVDSPLSVDTLVWPSLFLYPGGRSAEVPVLPQAVRVRAVDIPPHQSFDLWRDLDLMRHVATCRHIQDLGQAVAILAVLEDVERKREVWQHAVPPRMSPDPHWEPLGYDVADESLLSGLANCGYSPADRARLADVASQLNKHGLFDQLTDARVFAATSDGRVPEHAPFGVFGLYRIA